MNDVHLKNHVVVHEVRQMPLVGDDTTDLSGSQEHILRFLGSEESFYCLLAAKVQFFMGTRDNIGVSLTLQLTHDSRTYHSPVAGYIYL